jgi:hypothetical protein
VICQPCRDQVHVHCPELCRWRPGTFPQGATELAGGQWCDCHHVVPDIWSPEQVEQFGAALDAVLTSGHQATRWLRPPGEA